MKGNFDFQDKKDVFVAEKEKKNKWWTMYYEGAVNVSSKKVGVVIIS